MPGCTNTSINYVQAKSAKIHTHQLKIRRRITHGKPETPLKLEMCFVKHYTRPQVYACPYKMPKLGKVINLNKINHFILFFFLSWFVMSGDLRSPNKLTKFQCPSSGYYQNILLTINGDGRADDRLHRSWGHKKHTSNLLLKSTCASALFDQSSYFRMKKKKKKKNKQKKLCIP